jgi:hypothetical protein
VLTERFAYTRTEELAREMGVCYRTLCRWAADLSLKKSDDFRCGMSAVARKRFSEHYADGQPKRGHALLDDETKAYMKENFPVIPNTALAKALGVNDRTVRRWASELGLKKDREVIEMHRRLGMLPSPEEWFRVVATVRELFPEGRDAEILELTGYSMTSVYIIAKKYGISRSERYRQEISERSRQNIVLVNRKRRGTKTRRTLGLEAAVRESYADTPTHELAERLGVSEIYVKILAGRMGIRKNKGLPRRRKQE